MLGGVFCEQRAGAGDVACWGDSRLVELERWEGGGCSGLEAAGGGGVGVFLRGAAVLSAADQAGKGPGLIGGDGCGV